MPTDKTENMLPFFARYLEGQGALEVRTDISAGQPNGNAAAWTQGGSMWNGMPTAVTKKYPSDDDENASI